MFKKRSSIMLCGLLLTAFVFAGCLQIGGGDIYPFNSVKVTYTYSGITTGDEYLYIKGENKASYKTLSEAGIQKDTLDLVLGDTKYYVNLTDNTALKSKYTDYEELKDMSREEKNEYLLRKALSLNENIDLPEPIGQSSFDEVQCDMYPTSLGSACIWEGIVLYQESSLGGVTTTKKAVKVEVGIDIPNEKFDLPQGVEVKN